MSRNSCISASNSSDPYSKGGSGRKASADGSEWDRRTATCPLCCGDEMRHTYYLRNVIQPDGTPGKFHAELEALADEKMVTAR